MIICEILLFDLFWFWELKSIKTHKTNYICNDKYVCAECTYYLLGIKDVSPV